MGYKIKRSPKGRSHFFLFLQKKEKKNEIKQLIKKNENPHEETERQAIAQAYSGDWSRSGDPANAVRLAPRTILRPCTGIVAVLAI